VDELSEIMNELRKLKQESSQLLNNLSDNTDISLKKEDYYFENKVDNLASEDLFLDSDRLIKKLLELEQKQLKLEKLIVALDNYNKEKIEKVEKYLEIISKSLANSIISLLKNNVSIDREIKEIKNALSILKNLKGLNVNDLNEIKSRLSNLEDALQKNNSKEEQIIKKMNELIRFMSKFIKNELAEIKLLIEQNKKVLDNQEKDREFLKDLEKKVLFLIEEINYIKKFLLENIKKQ